jgi:hypothetical protein
MNLDFSARPGFSAYVLLLMFAGIVMLVLGSPVVARRATRLRRIINLVFGVGFFCYGFYLAFLFRGGSYVIFFQAFIVPIVLIVNMLRTSGARRQTNPTHGPWASGAGSANGYSSPFPAAQPPPGQLAPTQVAQPQMATWPPPDSAQYGQHTAPTAPPAAFPAPQWVPPTEQR